MTEELYQNTKTKLIEGPTKPLPITPDDRDIQKYGLSVMPSTESIEMERMFTRNRKHQI